MRDRSSLLFRRINCKNATHWICNDRKMGAIASGLVFFTGYLCWESLMIPKTASAQITPDQTLGTDPSRVTRSNERILIEGGVQRGVNLFHSFQQFNVPQSQSVYFSNPDGVGNILSRVTGNSPSNILGRLGVDGPANLFLLNSNGILFGPDSQLDISGSFIGTTANQINFNNNQSFSAIDPSVPSILILNAPIGLQYGAGNRPGNIVIQGNLAVNTGETLTLAGGNIWVIGSANDSDRTSPFTNTGQLIAPQGNISLLAMQRSSNNSRQNILFGNQFTVNDESFNASRLSYNFADILIENEALIFTGNDSSVGDAGQVRIDGHNILIRNNARLSARNSRRGNVGLIAINAIEDLSILNQSTINNQASNRPTSQGMLRGILLESSEGSVTVRHSFLRTNVESEGTASRIRVAASDRALIHQSIVTSQAQGEAGGGRIRIIADDIIVRNDSNINSSTASQSQTADAGKIIFDVFNQLVINDAQLSSGTEGSANGDDIKINATGATVRIINGGQLTSSTSGSGDAGRITIESQNLRVSGFNPEQQDRDIFSGIFSRVRENGAGNASRISVNADRIQLVNGGRISTSVTEGGQGDAGDLIIDSNRVNISSFTIGQPLGRRSGLFARITSAASGNGGNIRLRLRDALEMRNGSRISTNVDASGPSQNGGNINLNISQGYILATPGNSNTDITANALDGGGGRVTITTPGLFQLSQIRPQVTQALLRQVDDNSDPTALLRGVFGFTNRSRSELSALLNTNDPQQLNPWRLASNDITAVSQTNPELSGEIVFRTPDIDPSQDSIDLPTTLVDAASLLDVDVCQLSSNSSFVSVGQGGLPPTPGDLFMGDRLWQDQRLPYIEEELLEEEIEAINESNIPENYVPDENIFAPEKMSQNIDLLPPIEAQGWVTDDTGTVALVASNTTVLPQTSWIFYPTCETMRP